MDEARPDPTLEQLPEVGRLSPAAAAPGRVTRLQAMPALDQLDRQIAAALQVSPRATWRHIAAAVESSEATVKRRAERLFRAGVIRTTVARDAVAPEIYVLMQFACDLSRGSEVAQALARRADTRFVALVTGPFDVVAEVVAPSSRELARVILEELAGIPGITRTTTETILRNFKTSYDWSHDLLGTRGAGLASMPPGGNGSTDPATLDDIDQSLIQRLTEDGRASYADLAARCGITESMARRRVEHLFTRAGFLPITLVDPGLLGYNVELLLWLRVDLAQLEQVAAALVGRREVRYISATSGYSDLACELIMRSQHDLYDFMTHVLGKLPGIRQVDMASELVTLKRAYVRVE